MNYYKNIENKRGLQNTNIDFKLLDLLDIQLVSKISVKYSKCLISVFVLPSYWQ